jgi:lipopolysaccharide/colanic/teichoic acid biosynthesis glycosyltransferase
MQPATSPVSPASTSEVPDKRDPGQPVWKRLLDLVCILIALPVAGPLIILIAIGIRLVSKGPVLFCQPRIGYQGRPFVCLKFRTMRADANTAIHEGYFKQLIHSKRPMMKLDSFGDSRLIPFGSLLRCSGLDELPQLFNVWHGDMSLVGPRPCTPNEYREYLPWQKQRFSVLPGLTGLWQVSGKNKTTFEEMIQLDILYAQKLSLRLDLKIILKTLPVLVGEMREMLGRRRFGKSKDMSQEGESHGKCLVNGHETHVSRNNGRLVGAGALEGKQGEYPLRHALVPIELAKRKGNPGAADNLR